MSVPKKRNFQARTVKRFLHDNDSDQLADLFEELHITLGNDLIRLAIKFRVHVKVRKMLRLALDLGDDEAGWNTIGQAIWSFARLQHDNQKAEFTG